MVAAATVDAESAGEEEELLGVTVTAEMSMMFSFSDSSASGKQLRTLSSLMFSGSDRSCLMLKIISRSPSISRSSEWLHNLACMRNKKTSPSKGLMHLCSSIRGLLSLSPSTNKRCHTRCHTAEWSELRSQWRTSVLLAQQGLSGKPFL